MKSFTTATTIATFTAMQVKAVNIQHHLQGMTLAEVEGGCGGNGIGTPFQYFGPSMYKPAGFPDITPGMNLAQTSSGAEAPKDIHGTPKDVRQLAEIRSKRMMDLKRGQMELAQAQQDKTIPHTCQSAHNLNKSSNVDFAQILSGDASSDGAITKFTDERFPTTDALYWADLDINPYTWGMENTPWRRVGEVFDKATHSIWGNHEISPRDMAQGGIGNCWYIAAAAALAEFPDRLDKVVENAHLENSSTNDLNDVGIYAFNMYAVGVPITIIVDDYLPLVETTDGYRAIMARVGNDNSLWGPLMEKAFAKLHGNYDHIVGGWMNYGVSALNGSPHINNWHSDKTKEEIWDFIKAHNDDNNIITMGILPPAGEGCYSEHPTGLQYCHAYSTIHTYEWTKNGKEERVVLVRNPWASNYYNGKWTWDSNKWNKKAKEAVGYDEIHKEGGYFFMDWEEYFEGVTVTSMNYDTYDWNLDYFLMLDDEVQEGDSADSTSTGDYCLENCTVHYLSVTSEVDQNVHIGAHIWQDRSYSWNNQCWEAHRSWQSHEWIDETTSNHFALDGGQEDVWQEPVFMEAGSTHKIKMLLDWNRENVTKDWSLTAWGEKGKVIVTHANSLETQHMPSSGLWDDKGGPEPTPIPEPIPIPDPSDCVDTDNGALDTYGTGCDVYYGNEGWCGGYDDDDFDSMEMCCACGGGQSGADPDPDPQPNPDPTPDPDPIDDSDPIEVFNEYDTDQDGKLTQEEFNVIFWLYCDPCGRTKEEVFAEFDNDGDGVLTQTEFSNLYCDVTEKCNAGPDEKEEYEIVLAKYDTDGDQCLNAIEFAYFYQDRCSDSSGANNCEESAVDMFYKYDEDSNGCLSLEEFDKLYCEVIYDCKTPEKILAYFDTNGDQCLTFAEFQRYYNMYCEGKCTLSAWELFKMFNTSASSAGTEDDCLDLDEFKNLWEYINGDDTNPNPDPNPNPSPFPDLGEQSADFDAWVAEEEIDNQGFNCVLNTRLYWSSGYKIFAGHDCDMYDLRLTIMMSRIDMEQNVQYSSIGAKDQLVKYEDIGKGDVAATFLLSHDNPNLGIWLNENAEANVHYDTFWEYT